MWFSTLPAAVAGLVALTFIPHVTAKPYPVHLEEMRELHNASQIVKRQCAGQVCGWGDKYCCTGGQVCYTSGDFAGCGTAAATTAAAANGWMTYTTTWVETVGLVTRTSVWSTYVGATAQATPTAACGVSQQACASKCCDSGYYCADYSAGTCKLLGGGSSGGISGTVTPSAPQRPTSSGLIVVTVTGTAASTVPFSTPIPTGVNGTLVSSQSGGGGGLSGGAIAGIVIGVIAGVILLLLLCAFCCARAAFDGIMAILGLGRRRKHTHEETYIEEHHHSSAGGGGRRWYGQPSRPQRPPRSRKSGGGLGNALGIGAALGGLALALGIKRRNDRRHDEKSTTISGSSAYYSDYTSSSSASSSDRRSRPTRHSSRR